MLEDNDLRKRQGQAERLALLLDELNFKSKRQMALAIKIDPSQLGRIMRGEINLPYEQAKKFNEKYGISIEWLLDGKEEMRISSPHTIDKSLEKLIENNTKLAEANKMLAEGNRLLIGKLTEGGIKENSEDVHARLQAFLELLTEVSRGQKFFSAEEAGASYANKMYRIERENRKKDIQAAKGT